MKKQLPENNHNFTAHNICFLDMLHINFRVTSKHVTRLSMKYVGGMFITYYNAKCPRESEFDSYRVRTFCCNSLRYPDSSDGTLSIWSSVFTLYTVHMYNTIHYSKKELVHHCGR